MAVDQRSSPTQITQQTLDVPNQAIRVIDVGAGSGGSGGIVDVSIDGYPASGDNIAILGSEDSTMSGAKRVLKVDSQGRLITVTTGTFSAQVTDVPPDDFRVQTYTISATPTAIIFTLFDIVAVSISVLSDNIGYVRIGKADVATNHFLAAPGSSLNMDVNGSDSPVFFQADPGASGRISVLVTGNNI
jgi:hypothetical protein